MSCYFYFRLPKKRKKISSEPVALLVVLVYIYLDENNVFMLIEDPYLYNDDEETEIMSILLYVSYCHKIIKLLFIPVVNFSFTREGI